MSTVTTETTDTHVTTQTDTKAPALPYAPKAVKYGLIILLIVSIGFAVYFYNKYSKKAGPATTGNSNAAEDIRQTFGAFPTSTQPSITANPIAIAPTPSPTTSTGTPVQMYPGEILDAASTPTPTSIVIPTITPTPVPQNFVYNNPNLNFQATFPSGWHTVYDQSGNVGFQNDVTRQFGYIETYQNTSGETLDSIASTLSSSPSVQSIQNISLDNKPALYYQGSNPSQSGIALVYKDKIYYLHNDLIAPNVVNGFRFLN